MSSPNSTTTTHGIEVSAAAQYLEERSRPEQKRWLYAYRIRIRNVGVEPMQLLRRHWVITDGNGEVREVRGDGVGGRNVEFLLALGQGGVLGCRARSSARTAVTALLRGARRDGSTAHRTP